MRFFTSAVLLVLALQLTAHAEHKVLKVGTQPESVCRGFGGKLYVTIINGDAPGDGGINVGGAKYCWVLKFAIWEHLGSYSASKI